MNNREGMIPTTLGTVVTVVGTALVAKKISPKLASGILGFGLAHMVLGSIDLVEHRQSKHWFS
jgi:hypothetical protein